ncbi:zinc finger CCHC domain-containing protein 9, partial [Elysia marginata]
CVITAEGMGTWYQTVHFYLKPTNKAPASNVDQQNTQHIHAQLKFQKVHFLLLSASSVVKKVIYQSSVQTIHVDCIPEVAAANSADLWST